jgi:predicted nucleotidyltransferase
MWIILHKSRIMGAADFLFTPSVQRVLTATFSHPDRAYTLEELLSAAATGRGSTQHQIERLLTAGVLKEEPRRGRQRSIRANTEHFLYPELSSIVRKSFGMAEPLKEALRPFAQNIEEAFVFGSVAKGTDSERSDVDLIVVGDAPLLELTEAVHTLEQHLGRAIHLNLYASTEWRELVARDTVMAQIAHGPKLQLIPDAKTT